jgi:hypothetical protein
MKTKYLTVAETAQLVRASLKRAFPDVKFSLRSKSYSSGASIHVAWTDGPTTHLVDATAKQFQGGGFDGMIDLKYPTSHWLLPDGTTTPAHREGTTGSMGTVPPVREWMPHPDAKLVQFGADYVFTHRRYSERFIRHACARLARNGYPQFGQVELDTTCSGSVWIKNDRQPAVPQLDESNADLGDLLRRECLKLMVA